MNYRFLIFFVTISLLFSACLVQKSVAPSTTLNVQLNISLNDLEYIADTTIKVKQSYVLGIPYGGERYKIGQIILQNNLPNYVKRNRAFNNAIYQALTNYPDADFILPVSFKLEKNIMFLGREDELSIKVKLLKIPSLK